MPTLKYPKYEDFLYLASHANRMLYMLKKNRKLACRIAGMKHATVRATLIWAIGQKQKIKIPKTDLAKIFGISTNTIQTQGERIKRLLEEIEK